MLCLKNIERKLLNIAIFNEAIKELSLKYSMQDIDIINLFIETSEEIFNSKMQLYCKEDNVYLVKIENQNTHKKINLNTNTLKKISLAFEVRLKELNKLIQVQKIKKILKNKKIISFEIVKIKDDGFLCFFEEIIAFLPINNIPQPDINRYIIGSIHFGMIYSYTNSGDIVLNCKHTDIEIKKANDVMPSNIQITKINRYYGKRVKIYANEIPEKVFISNLKMVYPNEKIVFLKENKENYEQ